MAALLTGSSILAGRRPISGGPRQANRASASGCVRVCCSQQRRGRDSQQNEAPVHWKLLAVGLAAATLVHPYPAEAGKLVLVKPERRKLFQDEPKAPSAPGTAAPKAAFKAPSFSAPSLGPSPALVALPATVAILGGLALAVPRLDAGFSEFFDSAIVKNSNYDGAGYETFKTNGLPKAVAKAKEKVKKQAKKAGGFFGKK